MGWFDRHAWNVFFGFVWQSPSQCWSCCRGVRAAQPTVDGVVKVGEYDHSTMLGDGLYTLSWTVVGDTVWFGIRATTTGWVALGIDPQIAMSGADMVFGWVSGGRATVLDQYSVGMFGPHADDTRVQPQAGHGGRA